MTPLRSLVLLRRDKCGDSRVLSTVDLPVDSRELGDLERYMDVTRGEFLFARGVVLVEGDAEEFLLPVLARHAGYMLDESGISVCAVRGAYFTPYVQFLLHLEIPFVVVTDGDPDGKGSSAGEDRARALVAIIEPQLDTSKLDASGLRRKAQQAGVFVGDHTFEVDLFRSGWHQVLTSALSELTTNGAAKRRAGQWDAAPASLDANVYLADIKPIGKGRFAQRVAADAESLSTAPPLPDYLAAAIAEIATRTQ